MSRGVHRAAATRRITVALARHFECQIFLLVWKKMLLCKSGTYSHFMYRYARRERMLWMAVKKEKANCSTRDSWLLQWRCKVSGNVNFPTFPRRKICIKLWAFWKEGRFLTGKQFLNGSRRKRGRWCSLVLPTEIENKEITTITGPSLLIFLGFLLLTVNILVDRQILRGLLLSPSVVPSSFQRSKRYILHYYYCYWIFWCTLPPER